jgi:carboxyl-terminal processing protease
MRLRFLVTGLAALVMLGALGHGPASAQTATTISISPRSGPIDDLLLRGRKLESERRWGEALTHYEDAIRLYPGNPGLQQRFAVSRQYFDLSRRYADRSFCTAIGQTSFSKSLDLYVQVLLKVQSFYVDTPDWRGLVDHGTFGLQTALGEPAFLSLNVSDAARREVEPFVRELQTAMSARTITTRSEARDAVAAAAVLAHQRLGVTPTAVVMEYLCGACNALDQYSAYLTPDQLNEVYSQIEGNFVGLGVELKAQDGLLTIVRVITGSPAQQAGLVAGDQILSVDDQSTANLPVEQAANLLQGQEGSTVRLSVATPGGTARTVVARRQRVEVPSIDAIEMVDRQTGIAYLRLTCFQKTTSRDLDAALWKLHREGMRSLIIDLRGNPGGLLVTAVEVSDRFLERGVIVSTRGRSVQEDFTYAARSEGTWGVPLLVIIDHNSASAAEIFAGAIRDHRRGTVVGVRSFGKGSVQGIFPLDGASAGLRLTTAKFYSPAGRPYSNVGVDPDILVNVPARPADATGPVDDAAMTAAVQAARGALSATASAKVGG